MNRVKGSQFRDVMLFPNPSPSQGSPCLDVTKISRRRQLRDNCPTFVQASLISPPCHWFPETLDVCWAAATLYFSPLPRPLLYWPRVLYTGCWMQLMFIVLLSGISLVLTHFFLFGVDRVQSQCSRGERNWFYWNNLSLLLQVWDFICWYHLITVVRVLLIQSMTPHNALAQ